MKGIDTRHPTGSPIPENLATDAGGPKTGTASGANGPTKAALRSSTAKASVFERDAAHRLQVHSPGIALPSRPSLLGAGQANLVEVGAAAALATAWTRATASARGSSTARVASTVMTNALAAAAASYGPIIAPGVAPALHALLEAQLTAQLEHLTSGGGKVPAIHVAVVNTERSIAEVQHLEGDARRPATEHLLVLSTGFLEAAFASTQSRFGEVAPADIIAAAVSNLVARAERRSSIEGPELATRKTLNEPLTITHSWLDQAILARTVKALDASGGSPVAVLHLIDMNDEAPPPRKSAKTTRASARTLASIQLTLQRYDKGRLPMTGASPTASARDAAIAKELAKTTASRVMISPDATKTGDTALDEVLDWHRRGTGELDFFFEHRADELRAILAEPQKGITDTELAALRAAIRGTAKALWERRGADAVVNLGAGRAGPDWKLVGELVGVPPNAVDAAVRAAAVTFIASDPAFVELIPHAQSFTHKLENPERFTWVDEQLLPYLAGKHTPGLADGLRERAEASLAVTALLALPATRRSLSARAIEQAVRDPAHRNDLAAHLWYRGFPVQPPAPPYAEVLGYISEAKLTPAERRTVLEHFFLRYGESGKGALMEEWPTRAPAADVTTIVAALEQHLGDRPLALLDRYRESTRYDPKTRTPVLQPASYQAAVNGIAPHLVTHLASLTSAAASVRSAALWQAADVLSGTYFADRELWPPIENVVAAKRGAVAIADTLPLSFAEQVTLFEKLTKTGASEVTDKLLARLLGASAIADDRLLAHDPTTLLGYLEEGRVQSHTLKLDLAQQLMSGELARLSAEADKGPIDRETLHDLFAMIDRIVPESSLARDRWLEEIAWSLDLSDAQLTSFVDSRKTKAVGQTSIALTGIGASIPGIVEQLSVDARKDLLRWMLRPAEAPATQRLVTELGVAARELATMDSALEDLGAEDMLRIFRQALTNASPIEAVPLYALLLEGGQPPLAAQKDFLGTVLGDLVGWPPGDTKSQLFGAFLRTVPKQEIVPSIAYILSQQGEDKTDVKALFEVFGTVGVKFGQLCATWPIFGPEIAEQLKSLKDKATPMDKSEVEARLKDALTAEQLGQIKRLHRIRGSASVKTVVEAELVTGERVMLMLRRPNVEAQIETNTKLARAFIDEVKKTSVELPAPMMESLLLSLEEELGPEVDFRNEAFQTEALRLALVAKPLVDAKTGIRFEIPAVLVDRFPVREDFFVMAKAEGVAFSDLSADEKAHFGPPIVGASLHLGFRRKKGEADRHGGNFLVDAAKATVALIDLGQLTDLTSDELYRVSRFFQALGSRDAEGLVASALKMARPYGPLDRSRVEREVAAALRSNEGMSDRVIGTIDVLAQHGLLLTKRFFFDGLKAFMLLQGEQYTTPADFEARLRVEAKRMHLQRLPQTIAELATARLRQAKNVLVWRGPASAATLATSLPARKSTTVTTSAPLSKSRERLSVASLDRLSAPPRIEALEEAMTAKVGTLVSRAAAPVLHADLARTIERLSTAMDAAGLEGRSFTPVLVDEPDKTVFRIESQGGSQRVSGKRSSLVMSTGWLKELLATGGPDTVAAALAVAFARSLGTAERIGLTLDLGTEPLTKSGGAEQQLEVLENAARILQRAGVDAEGLHALLESPLLSKDRAPGEAEWLSAALRLVAPAAGDAAPPSLSAASIAELAGLRVHGDLWSFDVPRDASQVVDRVGELFESDATYGLAQKQQRAELAALESRLLEAFVRGDASTADEAALLRYLDAAIAHLDRGRSLVSSSRPFAAELAGVRFFASERFVTWVLEKTAPRPDDDMVVRSNRQRLVQYLVGGWVAPATAGRLMSEQLAGTPTGYHPKDSDIQVATELGFVDRFGPSQLLRRPDLADVARRWADRARLDGEDGIFWSRQRDLLVKTAAGAKDRAAALLLEELVPSDMSSTRRLDWSELATLTGLSRAEIQDALLAQLRSVAEESVPESHRGPLTRLRDHIATLGNDEARDLAHMLLFGDDAERSSASRKAELASLTRKEQSTSAAVKDVIEYYRGQRFAALPALELLQALAPATAAALLLPAEPKARPAYVASTMKESDVRLLVSVLASHGGLDRADPWALLRAYRERFERVAKGPKNGFDVGAQQRDTFVALLPHIRERVTQVSQGANPKRALLEAARLLTAPRSARISGLWPLHEPLVTAFLAQKPSAQEKLELLRTLTESGPSPAADALFASWWADFEERPAEGSRVLADVLHLLDEGRLYGVELRLQAARPVLLAEARRHVAAARPMRRVVGNLLGQLDRWTPDRSAGRDALIDALQQTLQSSDANALLRKARSKPSEHYLVARFGPLVAAMMAHGTPDEKAALKSLLATEPTQADRDVVAQAFQRLCYARWDKRASSEALDSPGLVAAFDATLRAAALADLAIFRSFTNVLLRNSHPTR